MISLEEAQSRLIALATPLSEETVSLPEAIGRYCASPIRAKRTQPARDLSAMDGYAIAHNDLPGPFYVVGESAAGNSFKGRIDHGQAVRIFTGAAMPHGSDTVIIQEDIDREGDWIRIDPSLTATLGQHFRAAGGDFREGDVLIEPGDPLTAARIALAASGGYGAVPVRRRPSVEIIATGSELVPPGAEVGPDQLPESNSLMIAAMLHDFRCSVVSPGIVRDDMAEICAAIQSSTADILVTCGGASVGDHDLVRPALDACGAELDFWKVAMRPGKPLLAGRLGNKIILGLPGNPVSAFVTAFLFLRPLVATLSGAIDPLPRRITSHLARSLPANGPRIDHIRARRIGGMVEPFGRNDSAALVAMAQADALIIRQADAPIARIGDEVEIISIT
jgi:molybdopterin molybdotransferase